MHRHRRALRTVAVAGSIAVIVSATTSSASAQADWEVVASGLDAPRHLSFSSTGDLYVAESGRGDPSKSNCVEHPELGEFCLGFTGAVSRVRDNGPDERVVTGLPSIASETEQLGPSDIAFTGSKTFVLSIGLGAATSSAPASGTTARCWPRWSPAGSVVRGSRCSPTSWPTRQTPTPTARTSTATQSGCCDTATATWSPTPAATPSCRRRVGARSRRSPRSRRAAHWRRHSWDCPRGRRSRPMRSRPPSFVGGTGRTTSAS